MEDGVDFTVAHRHLAYLLKAQKLQEHNTLMHVLQGSLPTAENGLELVCSGCGIERPTLCHKLWRCPAVIQAIGPPPPAWERHLEDSAQQCLWQRGILPLSAAQIPTRHFVSEDDSGFGPMQGTGMWRDLCRLDATGLVFGTDGSGGPASSYKLHRLCSWAVVALEACPPHNLVATLRGPLPGTKQTVPLAEAHAMKVFLAFTDGPLTLCADSLGCVKRLKRIRARSPIKIEKWSNPAMWLHIQQLAGSREIHVAWLPSHQQRASVQEHWQFKANKLADQIAGDVAQSRASEPELPCLMCVFRFLMSSMIAVGESKVP